MWHMRMSLVALILRRPLPAGVVAALLLMGLGLAAATPGVKWGRSAASAGEEAAAIPGPVTDFALTDQEGRRVRLREQAGKVLLVNFVTTRCATLCVQVTRELRGLQQALGERMGREVAFLSVGLDPKADTRAALRKFAARHGADFSSWAFLSGTPEELDAARRAFGVLTMEAPGDRGRDSHEVEHTTTTYLLDRRGVLRKKIQPGILTLAGLSEIEAVLSLSPGT